MGIDSTFFSVVPNNSLGKSAVRLLRSNDVHCTPMILSTPEETPSHRLGTYYLETGYGVRPSKVIYDRKHSAMAEYDFSDVDLSARLLWLHPLVIHPLTLTDMAKRNSKTAAQQCRYYEVDNIFVYMVETYINGNFETFRRLYHELNKDARRDFMDFLLSEVEPTYWREILKQII